MGYALILIATGFAVLGYAFTAPGTQVAESLIGGAMIGSGISLFWRASR